MLLLRARGGALRAQLECAHAARARSAAAPALCGKHVKKGDLPSKVCVVCSRPYNWRVFHCCVLCVLPSAHATHAPPTQAQEVGEVLG